MFSWVVARSGGCRLELLDQTVGAGPAASEELYGVEIVGEDGAVVVANILNPDQHNRWPEGPDMLDLVDVDALLDVTRAELDVDVIMGMGRWPEDLLNDTDLAAPLRPEGQAMLGCDTVSWCKFHSWAFLHQDLEQIDETAAGWLRLASPNPTWPRRGGLKSNIRAGSALRADSYSPLAAGPQQDRKKR
jgi:hypothetical protein